MPDWTDDPRLKGWIQSVREELVPKLRDSACTISISPPGGESDVKFAVELGMSIMLDKPIIVVCFPGREVPPGLVRVAHAVVYGDPEDRETARRLADAIERVVPDE